MRNLKIKNNDCHAALAMTKSVQSGRSMIEMLGVLAIIGVLSVGGIAGYSKAIMKYKTNKTIEQITLLMTNIRTFFAPQRNYIGVHDKAILTKAKIAPEEMWTTFVDEGGSWEGIENAFGGEIIIYSDGKTSTGTTEDAVGILLTGTPQEACIEIATMDWRANSGTSLVNVTINGSSYEEYLGQYLDSCTTNARVTCAKDMPVNIDKAATACSNDDNAIVIKFY